MPDSLFGPQPTTKDVVETNLPAIAETDPTPYAVRIDAATKLKIPAEQAPYNPNDAKYAVKLNQLRNQMADIDQYPTLKRIMLESEAGPLFRDNITPLKIYDAKIAAARDTRPQLPITEGLVADIRSQLRTDAMILTAGPAAIQRALGGEADWWYNVGVDGIRAEAKNRGAFQEAAWQAPVGSVVSSLADPANLLLPGAGFAVGSTAKVAGKAAEAAIGATVAKQLTAAEIKNGITGAAAVTAAQQFVQTATNRSMQKQGDGGTAKLTPTEYAWAATEGIVQGIIMQKFGLVGSLAPFRPTEQRAAATIIGDIGKSALEEGTSGAVSAVTGAGIEDKLGQLTFGDIIYSAALEGIAGAGIGALNIPFLLRERSAKIAQRAVDAAHGVSDVDALAQATSAHDHIIRSLPPEASAAINAALGESSGRSFYFDREAWDGYWTSKNIDPADKLRSIGAKVEADGSVKVGLGAFIKNFAGDHVTQGDLVNIARPAPDGWSMADAAQEFQQAEEAVTKIKQDLLEQARTIHGGAIDDSGAIIEELTKEFSNVKSMRVKMAAKPAATLVAAGYHTLANDLNKELGTKYTPHELWKMYGFTVIGESPVGTRGGYRPGSMELGLTKISEASSVVHEIGHHFLDIRARIAADLETPALTADLALFNKWIQDNAEHVVSSYLESMSTPSIARDQMATLGGAQFIRENVHRLHELGVNEETSHAYRAIHEYFARGWETYIAEGKAPTPGLMNVFRRFTAWITKVYNVAANVLGQKLRVTLTPEARRFMDRLLVTEAAMRREADAVAFGTIVDDAIKLTKIPPEYMNAAIARTEETRAIVREEIIQKAIKDEYKATAKEQREMIQKIRDDMMSSEEGRAYSVLHELRDGTDPWTSQEHPTEFGKAMISRKAAKAMVTDAAFQALEAKGILDDRGADPDAVARNNNFDSSREMLELIAELKPYPERERELLDAAFGVIPSDAEMRLIVEKEFAGPRRQEMIDAEMAVLIKDFAAHEEKFVKLSEKHDKLKAEAKAASESHARMLDWVEAKLKGKNEKLREELTYQIKQAKEQGAWDVAAERKKAELLAEKVADAIAANREWNTVYTETKQQSEIRKAYIVNAAEMIPIKDLSPVTQRSLARNKRTKARKVFVEGDAAKANLHLIEESNALYMADAQEAIQERFAAVEKSIEAYGQNQATRNTLREGAALVVTTPSGGVYFYETSAQVAEHIVRDPGSQATTAVALADAIIGKWSEGKPEEHDITWNEDVVNNLAFIANGVKSANKQTAGALRANTQALANQLISIADSNAPKIPPKPGNIADTAFGFIAGCTTRFSTYINKVTGGKIGAWHHDVLYRIGEVGVKARATADKKIGVFNELAKATKLHDWVGGVYDKSASKEVIPGTLGYKLSVQERRAMLLHFGNVEGRQRVLEHLKLTGHLEPSFIWQKILATVTKDDIKYVNAIWKQNEENKVQLDDVYRSIGEIPPKSVKSLPFEVGPEGSKILLNGGYYTIAYADAQPQTHEDLMQLVTGQKHIYQSATPSQGLAQARATEVTGRQLDLSPSVHTRHLDEVSNILEKMAFAKSIQATMSPGNKVFESMSAKYGAAFAREFSTSMWNAITGPPAAVSKVDQFAQGIRGRASAAGLMFNIVAMVKQPLGLTSVVAHPDIPSAALAGSLVSFGSRPRETIAYVNAKSLMMKERGRVWSDASRDAYAATKSTPVASAIGKAGFSGFAVMQGAIDYPTWITAYETYLNKFQDEEKAVRAADQLIRDVMGSGEESEMTAMHQNQWSRLLTIFGNYNITQLNMLIKAGQNFRRDDWHSWVALAGAAWFGVMVAALANYCADYALKGGKFGPKEGQSYANWMTKQQAKAFVDTTWAGRIVSDMALAEGSKANVAAMRPAEIAGRIGKITVNAASGESVNGEQLGKAIIGASPYLLPTPVPASVIDRAIFGDNLREKVVGKPYNVTR